MNFQKLTVTIAGLAGGAVGLLAPIGVVFFLPVWCLLVVAGLLIGRRLGLSMSGGKRVVQR